MKAIVYTKYGPPESLKLEEVPKPTPNDDQVLVKVHAASVNALDWHTLMAKPFLVHLDGGLLKPKNNRLGADMAGHVEAVGKNVTQFKQDDEVYGFVSGGFAEYVCAREKRIAWKPANMSFEEAAAVPIAALTALQGLRKAQIKPGQKVLINGASGGVGTFAVQIAKTYGAEVTAVCSTRNVDRARSLGADHVIDYTKEDFTKSGEHYAVIFAANGYRWILSYTSALSSKGIYLMAGGSMGQLFQALLLGPLVSKFGSKKMTMMGIAKPNQEDLLALSELLKTGKIVPVIERRYPLDQVPEAVRYVEEGHAQGKVVITVAQ